MKIKLAEMIVLLFGVAAMKPAMADVPLYTRGSDLVTECRSSDESVKYNCAYSIIAGIEAWREYFRGDYPFGDVTPPLHRQCGAIIYGENGAIDGALLTEMVTSTVLIAENEEHKSKSASSLIWMTIFTYCMTPHLRPGS